MAFKLQEIVSRAGHYITLPDLYGTLDAARQAQRDKRATHGLTRIVSIDAPHYYERSVSCSELAH